MKRKILVITDENGEIVGTQLHQDLPEIRAEIRGTISARLVPGPGQKQHVVEIEIPVRLSTSDEIDKFHALVKKHIANKQ